MQLVILVRCTDEGWYEDVITQDEEGQDVVTGQVWVDGPFVALANAIPLTGDHKYKIQPGKAPVYIKDGIEYYFHGVDASRIAVPDYEAWANWMRSVMDKIGIVFEADTVDDVSTWLSDNGFSVKTNE